MKNMSLDDAVKILKEYVSRDRRSREEENPNSDYGKFCEEKNIAIDIVLDTLKGCDYDG